MAALVGLFLLLALSYLLYRDGRSVLDGRPSRNPVLRQLDRDVGSHRVDPDRMDHHVDAACSVDAPPGRTEPDTVAEASETAITRQLLAEASETALTRQLLAGAIEPSRYRRLMCELADSSTDTGGGR